MTNSAPEYLAETAKRACVLDALEAHEDARAHGLCPEGRLKAALSTLRSLHIRRWTEENLQSDDRST